MPLFYVRIPENRIGVLIGPNGSTKELIERNGKSKITIDSESGDVQIAYEDPFLGLKCRDVVTAIGRGFSPLNAMKLYDSNTYIYVMNINDFARDKKNHLRRIRARVIGTNGKTKKFIEKETNTILSIYGSTVSVIGTLEMVEIVKESLTLLMRGSEHNTIYRLIDRRVKEAMLNG
jgi:ribosomal RNA assembly protein